MLWNGRWSGCPRIGVRPEDTESCAVAIAPLGVQKRNLDIIRLYSIALLDLYPEEFDHSQE